MMVFLEANLIDIANQYLLPLFRIASFFMAAPIYGSRIVSTRVRLVLALSVTLIAAPLIAEVSDIPTITGINLEMMLLIAQQVLIGVALGFLFQVVFQLFVLAGQYIAMKMGLGFASMNDPANGVSVTIVSQFYLLTTTLLFLSINGHLILLDVLLESFKQIPIGSGGLSTGSLYRLVELGGWMFGGALTIALPVLTALLIVNIAFGVMSRSAPQMNIFAVGFPITLIFGLLIMWVGFSAFLTSFSSYVDQGVAFALNLLAAN